MQPDDCEGYLRRVEFASMRVSAGEEDRNRLSYIELMDRGKTDGAQSDPTRCGGSPRR